MSHSQLGPWLLRLNSFPSSGTSVLGCRLSFHGRPWSTWICKRGTEILQEQSFLLISWFFLFSISFQAWTPNWGRSLFRKHSPCPTVLKQGKRNLDLFTPFLFSGFSFTFYFIWQYSWLCCVSFRCTAK